LWVYAELIHLLIHTTYLLFKISIFLKKTLLKITFLKKFEKVKFIDDFSLNEK